MPTTLQDKLGICQWFHYQDFEMVERTLAAMLDLGLKHLRTGVSWADYHRPAGRRWYDWQMRTLADAGVDVLLSVWHTPPSIAEGGTCAGPPRRLEDYADFIELLAHDYGDCFGALELWNEPNNRLKWNFPECDPQWEKFGRMIGCAAQRARQCEKPTVLGGMIPVDHHWLRLMHEYGATADVDVIAIHGFPEMWWAEAPNWDWYSHWHGWDEKIGYVAQHARGKPIWITETGLATWDLPKRRLGRYDLQVDCLTQAVAAPAERVYWYSMIDLHPQRDAIEGFHVDENEYHLGLLTSAGTPKPAYHRMRELLHEPADSAVGR